MLTTCLLILTQWSLGPCNKVDSQRPAKRLVGCELETLKAIIGIVVTGIIDELESTVTGGELTISWPDE